MTTLLGELSQDSLILWGETRTFLILSRLHVRALVVLLASLQMNKIMSKAVAAISFEPVM
jgi:hypothetical protein